MKKFLWLVVAVKAPAALVFTGSLMWVTFLSTFFGSGSVPVGFIWQLCFLSLIFGVLHLVAFSENTLGRTRTPGRIAFLGLTMFAVLAVFAFAFRWFGEGDPARWLVFIGVYIAVFVVSTIIERVIFRIGGRNYHDLLISYKSRNS